MIKKLDKLIIKSFLGPFIVTFFIAVFVLMMQILWKYIDDLIGKGLDLITIGKFLWYASASLLTLAMPIAILISSIMTFGNLGESFELVAIKSAGISLLRFMRPLMWVAILLCGITFLFANYIIPYSQLKFATLYTDIRYKKPAFDLQAGVFFTHIPSYAIKVGKKDEDGKTIHNVLIYEHSNSTSLQDNSIIAESGVMNISADKNFLEFNLKNGYRYEERGNIYDTTTDFIRVGFKDFKKQIDLSSLEGPQTSDSVFMSSPKMLSARQLNKGIDSIRKQTDTLVKRMSGMLDYNLHFMNVKDSTWKTATAAANATIPDSAESAVKAKAIGVLESMKSTLMYSGSEIDRKQTDMKFHKMEWHRKFSLSLACLILFFIGAPLGSIIRKGGLGMPLIVAIIFFLIFHLLNMFGEKFVKEGLLPPAIGMWLAIIVLAPVGVFLTYKAMHDSQLFNKELYNKAFKRVAGLFTKKKTGNTNKRHE
jgi:lipopolysaccharide export system permease protein